MATMDQGCATTRAVMEGTLESMESLERQHTKAAPSSLLSQLMHRADMGKPQ